MGHPERLLASRTSMAPPPRRPTPTPGYFRVRYRGLPKGSKYKTNADSRDGSHTSIGPTEGSLEVQGYVQEQSEWSLGFRRSLCCRRLREVRNASTWTAT